MITKLTGTEQIDIADDRAFSERTNVAAIAALANKRYSSGDTPANLSSWTAKVALALKNTNRARINMYGDSTTMGSGGALAQNSPPSLLAAELTRRGVPATASMFGMNFANMGLLTAFEPRLTGTGTIGQWTQLTGGKTFRMTTNAATLNYAPGYACDTIDLYHYVEPGNGSFTITIDGGATQFSTPTSGGLVSSQTINQNLAANIVLLPITIAGAPALHTITITNGAALNTEIHGFEAYTAAVGNVLIRNMGATGYTSADLAGAGWIAGIKFYLCDLTFLDIGINDWNNGLSLTSYIANIATIQSWIDASNAGTSTIYWTPTPTAFTAVVENTQRPFVQALRDAAGTNKVLMDWWQYLFDLGGYAALQPAGIYTDTLHPSALGNLQIAKMFANSLVANPR